MDARVLYFDECPGWRTAHERLREALTLIGRQDVPVTLVQVRSEDDASASGFAGSPTILIDGVDVFPGSAVPGGLALPAVPELVRPGRGTHGE